MWYYDDFFLKVHSLIRKHDYVPESRHLAIIQLGTSCLNNQLLE